MIADLHISFPGKQPPRIERHTHTTLRASVCAPTLLSGTLGFSYSTGIDTEDDARNLDPSPVSVSLPCLMTYPFPEPAWNVIVIVIAMMMEMVMEMVKVTGRTLPSRKK